MSAKNTLSSRSSSVNPASDAGPTNLYPLHPRKVLAAKRKGLSPRAWSVLCNLATYANKNDSCWPKIQTLAAGEAASRSTINRAIRELVDAGYVERVERPGYCNLWHLLWDPLDLVRAAVPAPSVGTTLSPQGGSPPPPSKPTVTGGGVTNDMPPPGAPLEERSGYKKLSIPPPPETPPKELTEDVSQEAPVPVAKETTLSLGGQDEQLDDRPPRPSKYDIDARAKAQQIIQTLRTAHLTTIGTGPSPYPRGRDDIREWYPALRIAIKVPPGPDRDAWIADLTEVIGVAYQPDNWWAGRIPWVLNLEKSLPRLLQMLRLRKAEAAERERSEERRRIERLRDEDEAQRVAQEHKTPDTERRQRRSSIQERIREAMIQARREGLTGREFRDRVEALAKSVEPANLNAQEAPMTTDKLEPSWESPRVPVIHRLPMTSQHHA